MQKIKYFYNNYIDNLDKSILDKFINDLLPRKYTKIMLSHY